MNKKVNYDVISPVYNSRYLTSPLNGVQKFLEKTIEENSPQKVLEVGCGTGYWLISLSKYNVNLYGADYSIGMLNEAQKSVKHLKLSIADANRLPFKENNFDLIFVINAIHQFGKFDAFIHHTYDLLKSNGTFVIIGLEPSESKNNWYLYRYFDSTYEIDLKRYPTFRQLKDEMTKARFSDIEINLVHRIDTFKKNNDVLNDHFLDKRGASQLALLSNEEYQIGINKIKSDIDKASNQNKDITFETRLNFYAVSGKRL